ncbi:MAG: STAS domain-containing protein [Ilumatobacteraceae bacterium]
MSDVATQLSLTSCAVDLETTASAIVVRLAGELDMADADRVAQVLRDATSAGRPIVRLELSGLSFADSSAIKAIILGAQSAAQRGVTFELVNPHRRVRRLLEVTGLVKALTIIDEPVDQQGPNSL